MRPTARSLAFLSLMALVSACVGAPAGATESAVPAVDDAAADIRDIRPPLHLSAPTPWSAYAAGGLALLLAAAGGAVWLGRRSRGRSKTDWEIALARLEEAAELMQQRNAYAFSIAVAEAVRSYLEKRFDMPIQHKTTHELLWQLAQDEDGPLGPWRAFLQNFLDHCDLAKYARWQLELAQMEAMYGSARHLVRATRPSPSRRARLGRHRARPGKLPVRLSPAAEGGPR